MAFIIKLTCVCCGAEYREGEALTCGRCGPDEGILDVVFDLPRVGQSLTPSSLSTRPLTHWRYRELLPLEVDSCRDDLVVGSTPLIEAPRLAEALGVGRIRLKDEGRSASASFKDRASSIGVARALQEGADAIACASTGNAASSLAHCAAVVGLPCNIFVPKNVPEGKLGQLLAYGARVFKVLDTYAKAYELCNEACARFGWYNRNCAINPYLVEGKKTGGLELAEQCTNDPPDWVSVSVGDGCTIAGIAKGLMQMKSIGLVDWSARVLGVQAVGVAPIARAFETGRLESSHGGDTYADSINCPVPRNWRKAVHGVRESSGAFVTVDDSQIKEAVRMTGRLSGVFAEPAAAAAVAGVTEAVRLGIIDRRSSVVVMITGNGLKDIAGALGALGKPHEIKPSLDEVARIAGS
ncbi:MAG: threonine synthase [Planctomycetota bacterium]